MSKVTFARILAVLVMVMMVACGRTEETTIPTDTPVPMVAAPLSEPSPTVVSAHTPKPAAIPVPTPQSDSVTAGQAATPVPTPISTPTPTQVPAQTAIPEPTQTAPSEQVPAAVIPPYVALVEIRNASGEVYSYGNAFLVDRDERLFATNAHIVEEILEGQPFSIHVQVDGVWYPAEAKEDWANLWTDVAIIRIREIDVQLLPEAAHLGGVPPVGSEVQVRGYLANREEAFMPDASLEPYSADAFVIGVDAEMAIDHKAWEGRALPMDAFLMSRPEGVETFEIPRELRNLYYRHYILVALKEPDFSQRFRPGTSGMPVLREGGDVVGMMALYVDIGQGIGGFMAFAVPAEEIEKLLEKVNGMLE